MYVVRGGDVVTGAGVIGPNDAAVLSEALALDGVDTSSVSMDGAGLSIQRGITEAKLVAQ